MISIYRRRRIRNALALTLSLAAASLGLFWLGAILWTLVVNGIGGLNLHVFTMSTPAPGSQGGLLNAIYGSVVMTAIAVAIGTPVGIMAGTYLSEFGKHNALAEATRFVNDILLSAPSIIIGLFVYEAMVLKMGHFSGWAGAVALAIIVIPVVVRTTEDMLQLVPVTLRESAAALGAPQWKVTVRILYRAAMQGMITGVMLAIARVSGETAPLLFTALSNNNMSTDLNGWMASLPVVIFNFAMSPYDDWQRLAWAGALLITVVVLLLSITARAITRRGAM